MYTLENYAEDKEFEKLLIAYYESPKNSIIKLLLPQSKNCSSTKKEIGDALKNQKEE